MEFNINHVLHIPDVIPIPHLLVGVANGFVLGFAQFIAEALERRRIEIRRRLNFLRFLERMRRRFGIEEEKEEDVFFYTTGDFPTPAIYEVYEPAMIKRPLIKLFSVFIRVREKKCPK